MAKKLIQTALAIGTVAGSLAVATANPAHAASATHIRRYSRDLRVWAELGDSLCQVVSNTGERHIDVPFGGTGFAGADRTLRCASRQPGAYLTTIVYRSTGTWDWAHWAQGEHRIEVSHATGGVTYWCGVVATPSAHQGWVADTFSRVDSPNQIFANGTLTCGGGTVLKVGFVLFEGWEGIVK